eukprot:TRINITY_DN8288_c0_g1_i1.p1 TRINITY_DN8288_c0_g1~~TRINITY_DN8288_c0_g1_i1.p1  ORF type:complete len:199 (-),score=58.82 TRINITY_DN8288_c0_g1_i1:130-726(-)
MAREGGIGSIQELVDVLNDKFMKGKDAEEVKEAMGEYINSGAVDWKEHTMWSDVCYTRNLLEANENYELMVICWKKGQKSPIHNHAGSSCWMAVLSGAIEETYYNYKGENMTPGNYPEGPCPRLEEGRSEPLLEGQVGYIRDEIALHLIKPLDGDAVSLHMYSPPIKVCNIYSMELGKVFQKKLGFYSMNKTRVQPEN